MEEHHKELLCPFRRTLQVVGRQWNVLIIRELLSGKRRFCQLENAIPGITPAMLSKRLKELEEGQILKRIVHTASPIQVEYALTTKGIALQDVLDALTSWGQNWESEPIQESASA